MLVWEDDVATPKNPVPQPAQQPVQAAVPSPVFTAAVEAPRAALASTGPFSVTTMSLLRCSHSVCQRRSGPSRGA